MWSDAAFGFESVELLHGVFQNGFGFSLAATILLRREEFILAFQQCYPGVGRIELLGFVPNFDAADAGL